MKIAVITDTHFGVRMGLEYFHQRMRRFYEDVFFPTLRDRGIRHVLHLGDMFDRRKHIDFASLAQCKQYFFDPLASFGIEMIALVGNHDIPYRNTLTPNSPDLLVARQYPNVRIIDEPTIVEMGSAKVLLMPWICQENYERSMSLLREAKTKTVRVVAGHFEIAGFAMYQGAPIEDVAPLSNGASDITYEQAAHSGFHPALFDGYDLVMSGHFHHRSQRGNIIYVGNPYELTFADCNDPRGFHVWNTDDNQLEFIANPYTSFTRIVYDDAHEQDAAQYTKQLLSLYGDKIEHRYVKIVVNNRNDYYAFDNFVNVVESLKPYDLKIAMMGGFDFDVAGDEVESMQKIEDTRELIEHYVETAAIDVDKQKLKHMMRRLYEHAISAPDA